MRILKTKKENFAYLCYRLISPIFDPIKFYRGIYGYFWYLGDMARYKRKSKEKILTKNIFPQLHDRVSLTPFEVHNFFQEPWLFERVMKNRPEQHVDVGSTYTLCGYLSKIVKTTFVDIRPLDITLKNLTIVAGDILKLPMSDNSIDSLSSLHTIEHVGLGRYGDDINPKGMEEACAELSRVLKPGGRLYVTTPIGFDRVCFNSHRVTSVPNIIKYFNNLKLEEFSFVDDTRKFHENVQSSASDGSQYSLGMFVFTKTA